MRAAIRESVMEHGCRFVGTLPNGKVVLEQQPKRNPNPQWKRV